MDWTLAFLTLNVIGIAANLDNTTVGIAYGTKGLRVPYWVNFIINIMGYGFAFVGGLFGQMITRIVSVEQTKWIACIVLVSIGLYFLYQGYLAPRLFASRAQPPAMLRPGWRQAIALGFALSASNLVTSFGATVADYANIWWTSISIALWGYILFWLGNIIGIGVFARLFGKYSALAAGIALILVGIVQVR
ncbi:manganese efflux pump [Alicyclobacillus sp. SO9]|uniref:manganese efflux pump MntP n=1 Tax=Alicyclobacillus sp. SO9 TaxID=2665646 RepID=UPI0018E7990B|nr:manganese efflux pump [Alicyclobacillus sp. SO9]QQE77642.1 manganese efflux pump [Alicyclobacillus sp. SO9]